MTVWLVLAIVFAALAIGTSTTSIVFFSLWRRSKRRYTQLENSLRPAPRTTGPVQTAATVARNVVQQAARLREQGVTRVLSDSLEDLVQWAKLDRERIVRVADRDGIVTLFFSDIADSTALNERLGDQEWVRVLAAHDRLVRREVARADGVVVKTIGDGFMVVFARAESAVRAALAIQQQVAEPGDRRLRRTPLSLRIGIHSGTAISSGDDYLGRNVALCARIAAHAASGQTQVSADTRLAVGAAPGLAFLDEGQVSLKGIAEQVRLFTVETVPEQEPPRTGSLGIHDSI